MKGRTRGIVIALASGAAGAVLPAAVSVQMLDEHVMAAGLGAVGLMNAVIAFIHIASAGGSGRARNDERKAEAAKNQVAMTTMDTREDRRPGLPCSVSSNQAARRAAVVSGRSGWYGPNVAGAEHMFERLPVATKKPAKRRG